MAITGYPNLITPLCVRDQHNMILSKLGRISIDGRKFYSYAVVPTLPEKERGIE